jgi:light-harvesting complex 1 alpha chain
MKSRSNVRTNAIVFSVLGLVVGLLIHFIVLSSSRYNWIDPQALQGVLDVAQAHMAALL